MKKTWTIGIVVSIPVAILAVLLLLNSFTVFHAPCCGTVDDFAKCRMATAVCSEALASGNNSHIVACMQTCINTCRNLDGRDLVSNETVDEANCNNKIASACYYCSIGNQTALRNYLQYGHY